MTSELNRDINYYDLVITGDLGTIGEDILKEFMEQTYKIKLNNYIDAGTMIYDHENQQVFSGASGPISLPFVLQLCQIKLGMFLN